MAFTTIPESGLKTYASACGPLWQPYPTEAFLMLSEASRAKILLGNSQGFHLSRMTVFMYGFYYHFNNLGFKQSQNIVTS